MVTCSVGVRVITSRTKFAAGETASKIWQSLPALGQLVDWYRWVDLNELSQHEQGIVKHRRLTKAVLIEELWLTPVHPETPVSLPGSKSVSNQAYEFQLS